MQVGGIDVYPVGVLAAWQHSRQGMRGQLRSEWRYLKRQFKRRDWHAIRNSFNGYLAEPEFDGINATRCGHGWTKRRALNDLKRHMAECAAKWLPPLEDDRTAMMLGLVPDKRTPEERLLDAIRTNGATLRDDEQS